jgi:hypothetical protein
MPSEHLGGVITLAQVGRCTCGCHAAALPVAWREAVTTTPPCTLDEEGVA